MNQYDIALFQDLDISFKNEIYRYGHPVTFKKGQNLFLRDELMRYFYIVISGVIKTYQINLQNAKEQTIFLLQPGDMLDTVILLDHKPHDVMHETLEDTEVFRLPIDKVREWMDTNETFRQKFFPYLAQQMRHMETLATDLSLLSTSQRLIKLLMQSLDTENSHPYNIIHGFSHSEIAKLLGTVRHVVERHLRELEKENIIEKNRHKLEIKNIEKLLAKLSI